MYNYGFIIMKTIIKSFFFTIFAIFSIIVLSFVYGATLGKTSIIENNVNLISKNIPNEFRDMKIAVLNDIYLDNTKYTDNLFDSTLEKLNETDSDVVVLNGGLISPEYINKYHFNDDKLISKLITIRSKYGKFVTLSNEERSNKNVKEHLKNIYKKSGFITLFNTKRKIYFHDYQSHINFVNYEKPLNKKLVNSSEFTIAFSNQPENVLHIQEQPINYYLYGHTLGNLVKIPYIGKLFHNYTKKYESNLSNSRYGTIQLIENSGIGTRNLPLRVWNNPEIQILHLLNKE